MVEVLADDNGNINQKCFDKIFTACIKAGDESRRSAVSRLAASTRSGTVRHSSSKLIRNDDTLISEPRCTKVGWKPTESFQKDFKDGLLDKNFNAFPLVRQPVRLSLVQMIIDLLA